MRRRRHTATVEGAARGRPVLRRASSLVQSVTGLVNAAAELEREIREELTITEAAERLGQSASWVRQQLAADPVVRRSLITGDRVMWATLQAGLCGVLMEPH